MSKPYYLIAILLILLPNQLLAASTLPPMVLAYAIHTSQLIKIFVFLTIFFRRSIEKQRRLNWFFGAVTVLYLSSSMHVFQRFFPSPNSVLHEIYISFTLFIYFIFYWMKTWRGKSIG